MHNWLLTWKLAENTKSLRCDLCLCANSMVYHIGMWAIVPVIPGLCSSEIKGVIGKLEQNRPNSQKIQSVTSFWVAQWHLLSRVAWMYWITLFWAHVHFFQDFSVAILLRYNEFLKRIETKDTNSAKHELSLCSNGMVYDIGVWATVRIIPSLAHQK